MIDRFSTYDFITMFVPGTAFAAIVSTSSRFSITYPDLVVGASLYFFYGMLLSRVGSLLIQPLLEQIGFLPGSDHKRFMNAETRDPKILTMLEVKNLYRTTLTSILVALPIILMFPATPPPTSIWIITAALSATAVIFLLSLRKQAKYLESRIAYRIEKE